MLTQNNHPYKYNTSKKKKNLKKILRGSLQKNTKTAGKGHVYLC